LCMNSSIHLYPATHFTVVSNATFKAYIPPFFLYATDWIPSEVAIQAGLTIVNSSVPLFGTKFVMLQLNRTSSPGDRLNYGSLPDLHMRLKSNKQNGNVGGASSLCVKCSNGTISSLFDAPMCRLEYLARFSHLMFCLTLF
jgi:hypothetical protein